MHRKLIISLLMLVALVLTVIPVRAEDVPTIREKILESCKYETEVDVSACNVTVDDLETVYQILSDAGELPWYATGTYEYTYDTQSNLALTFTPEFLDKADYDRALYEQRIAEILEETVFDGMSQWQICLSIHDALAVQSQYDESLTLNKGYDLVTGGIAVCRGYAEAYQELLTRVGIPCEIVVSEAMDHAWNMVFINDNWYHVDVTWADPVPDCDGLVNHKYFLVTDEEISSGDDPHYGWETEHTCTDDSYMDGFWKDVRGRICYPDDMTSYLIRQEEGTNYICSRNEVTAEETLLYTDELEYIDIGEGSYGYPHLGLSLWNGKLWFSSVDTVYSMNLDGSDVVAEFAYDTAGNGKHIYSCNVANDTVYLTLRTHEDEYSKMELPMEPSGYHVHSYTRETIAPTCFEEGVTVYTCSCGIRVESDYTQAVEHDYQISEEKKASFFSSGYYTYTCSRCEDMNTEYIPQIDFSDWLLEDGYHRPLGMGAAVALTGAVLKRLIKKKQSK